MYSKQSVQKRQSFSRKTGEGGKRSGVSYHLGRNVMCSDDNEDKYATDNETCSFSGGLRVGG